MARETNVSEMTIDLIIASSSDGESAQCVLRLDNTDFWNAIKTWWIFPLHLMICGLLVFVLLLMLDGHKVQIDASFTMLSVHFGLYQTQVNALLSLALMSICLLSTTCTALLTWRMIFILLDKRSISLLEIKRLNNWRQSIALIAMSRQHLLWLIWAILTILLLWPFNFSSPLTTSAVAWISSTRLTQNVSQMQIAKIDQFANFARLKRDDFRYVLIVTGFTKTATDFSYITNTSRSARTRKFFDASLSTNSVINITASYFKVNLKWVNASSINDANVTNRVDRIDTSQYSDVNGNDFLSDTYGTLAILHDNAADGSVAQPSAPSTFVGKKYVWIRLGGWNPTNRLKDSSLANEKTPCSIESPYFDVLSKVESYTFFWRLTNHIWISTSCFLMTEAYITAEKQAATNCEVAAFNKNEQYATCSSTNDMSEVEKDWLTELALSFTTKTLKFAIIQNLTLSFMSNIIIDKYTVSTLALGYHASWNALTQVMRNATKSATFRSAEFVIQARIFRSKLYG